MLLGVIADDFTGASDIASFISRLACEITAGRRFKSVQGVRAISGKSYQESIAR